MSKHWISSELSKNNRVLFIEPALWVAGLLRGKGSWRLDGVRMLHGYRKVQDNLTVFTPRLWPFSARNGKTLHEAIAKMSADAVEKCGFHEPILINFGTNPFLVKSINPKTSIYYCVDPAFPEPGEEEYERLTCLQSDLVYAISDAYEQRLAQFVPNDKITVIPHGFPVVEAQAILADTDHERPDELRDIHGPILGYAGSIHDSYVDIDLVERIATEVPDVTIVMIGPYKDNPIGRNLSAEGLRKLQSIPNVRLLGYRHFNDLPNYVRYFDVALILHRMEKIGQEAKTQMRTPFKLLQYLSQGKPIITPPLFELFQIKEMIYIADSHDAYLDAIHSALKENPVLRDRRMSYAREFSYQKILDRIEAPIVAFEGI
ncbi:MAG: hypothetical protein R3F42_14860 [Pseudomonadota bacterium]